jgi:hypothetical protein
VLPSHCTSTLPYHPVIIGRRRSRPRDPEATRISNARTTSPPYHYTTILSPTSYLLPPTSCLLLPTSTLQSDYYTTTPPLYHPTTLPPYHPTTLPPYHPTTIPLYSFKSVSCVLPVYLIDRGFHLLHPTSYFLPLTFSTSYLLPPTFYLLPPTSYLIPHTSFLLPPVVKVDLSAVALSRSPYRCRTGIPSSRPFTIAYFILFVQWLLILHMLLFSMQPFLPLVR